MGSHDHRTPPQAAEQVKDGVQQIGGAYPVESALAAHGRLYGAQTAVGASGDSRLTRGAVHPREQ